MMSKAIGIFILMFLFLVKIELHAEDTTDDNTRYSKEPEDNIAKIEESVRNALITIASKKEEYISNAPGVITVITQNELKRFGGTTLADILKRVPSFVGTTIYMTDRSVIASRGDQILPSSSHILLLINGRPVREVLEGGIKSDIYESFPVSVIEKIEVIRGPGSVLYGSQAISAVINVITKSPENNTISVSGALGEHLHNYIMADLQYRLGDLGIVFGGRYADKGGWRLEWDAPGLQGVYTYDITIPDYGPGFYGEVNFRDFKLMCTYTQWENQTFVPDAQASSMGLFDVTGNATWKKLFMDAGYTFNPTYWYKTSLNGTYTRSMYETEEFPLTLRDAFETVVEWTNFFSPTEQLDIIAGGVWGFMTGFEEDPDKNVLTYNRGVYNKGHNQHNFSGYTQIDYRWRKWCKVIGGIQVNKVMVFDSLDKKDNFAVDFNPRAGVILFPLEHINIKGLFSTAYRAPSINELYLDFSSISGKMVPHNDPHWGKWHEYDLKPEKVYTYDLGVNYQNEGIQIGINGFHTRMKNIIIQDRDTSRYQVATWDNMNETTIFGLECESKYQVTKEILFLGSFLYQQSKDDKTSESNVTPLPNFSVKGGLSYMSDYGLTVSAFNTFQEALDPKYYSDLNKTTKHFNMTNIHCSYDLNKLIKCASIKEVSLVLVVDNLLDVKVWLPAWGLIPGSTIPYNQGRTIYGGFKVSL